MSVMQKWELLLSVKQHPRLQLKAKANPNFRFDFIKM